MTINQAIETACSIRPNILPKSTFFTWINTIEGRIYTDILSQDFTSTYTEQNANDELYVPEPFCEVYIHYLISMIDHANGEYNLYANDSQLFNESYESFAKFYKRKTPKEPSRFKGWW